LYLALEMQRGVSFGASRILNTVATQNKKLCKEKLGGVERKGFLYLGLAVVLN